VSVEIATSSVSRDLAPVKAIRLVLPATGEASKGGIAECSGEGTWRGDDEYPRLE
jgi:hypothetical protein